MVVCERGPGSGSSALQCTICNVNESERWFWPVSGMPGSLCQARLSESERFSFPVSGVHDQRTHAFRELRDQTLMSVAQDSQMEDFPKQFERLREREGPVPVQVEVLSGSLGQAGLRE